ncbi:MAG: oligosaccharide flippase family protein, partial [Chitinophagaceae bacterium]|nr:oligosaccharide flippase family protein [Chitinophagaceae bacterium]
SMVLNLGLFTSQSKLYHDYDTPQERGKILYNINLLIIGGLMLFVFPAYLCGLDYWILGILFKNTIRYADYRIWILLMILTSLFAFMLTNFLYTSERINTVKRYSLCRTFGVNIISIAVLYAWQNTDSIRSRLAITSCAELALLLVFYVYYIKEMRFMVDKEMIRKVLRIGLPMLLSTLFSIVINFGDKFFLEKYIDYKTLSVYYLAIAFASVISILSTSLQNVWLPLFLKEKDIQKNLESTGKIIRKLVLLLIVLTVAIIGGFALCIILQIIPTDYSEVLYILPILLIGQIMVTIAILYSNYLIYFERTSLVSWAGLAVSTLSVGLNILLIPHWKAYGAAVTLLISNGCYLVIYYLALQYFKKKHAPVTASSEE